MKKNTSYNFKYLSKLIVAVPLLILFASAKSKADAPQLERFFRSKIIKLSREIITFHYEREKFKNPEDVPQDQISKYIENQVTSAVQPDIPPEQASATGYYAATDPASSRYFGGKNFDLFVANLKSGATILDIRSLTDGFRDSQVVAEAKANGCIEAKVAKGQWPWTYEKFRANPSRQCRQIFIETIKKIEIDAVFYNYSSASYIPHCARADQFAVIVVNMNGIDSRSISLFGNNRGKYSNEKLRGYISRLFTDSLLDPRVEDSIKEYPRSLWSLDNKKINTVSYREWLKEYVIGCGNYPEDNPGVRSSAGRFSLSLAASVKALQKRALNISKRLGMKIDIYNFKKLAVLQFRSVDLAPPSQLVKMRDEEILNLPEFKAWLDAVITMRSYRSQSSLKSQFEIFNILLDKMALNHLELFRENERIKLIDAYLKVDFGPNYYQTLVEKPGRLYDNFYLAGIPKIITAISYDYFLREATFPPALLASYPTGNHNYAEEIKTGFIQSLSVMSQCLNFYQALKLRETTPSNPMCEMVK
jgi:hypothetical protein